MDPSAEQNTGCGFAGLTVGGILSGLAVAIFIPILFVPPGNSLKPMVESALLGLFVLLGLFAGFPVSVAGLFRGTIPQRVAGAVGCVMNLSVWPIGVFALEVFAFIGGHVVAN